MNNYILWAHGADQKRKQVEEQPAGTQFYIFSTKWTNPLNGKKRKHDEFVKIWWMPNSRGYTYDLNEAGKYTKEELLDPSGRWFEDCVYPLPVHLVEAGEFGKVMKSVYN
jgi:hypothetical protein